MRGWDVRFAGACYLLSGLGDVPNAFRRLGAAQLDRPLVVLSCAAPARGHALSVGVHHTELADGVGMILRRGLLDPWHRLRVVHIHTAAIVVHEADHMLAHSVTRLGTNLERRHRSQVVDRHAEAPVADHAKLHGCTNVALVRGE